MNEPERLAELGHEFHKRGWVLGTSGNFSAVVARDPLRLVITASSLDKGRLQPEDILEINAQAQVVGTKLGKPSAETLLHIAIVNSLISSG